MQHSECIAVVRLCKKCGKPAGFKGMYVDASGKTVMATKYCGDGNDKDDPHDFTDNRNNDNKLIITVPWPYEKKG